MNILRIIPSVNPAHGGPVAGMIASATEMAKLGWQNEVLSLDEPTSPWVGTCPVPTTGVGPTGPAGFTRDLGRWIAREHQRFDVAVLHGIWSWATLGGGRACKRVGLPYVVFSHGMLDPYFRQQKPLKHWIKQVFWIGQGPVMRDAAKVLFTAHQEAELARRAFWGPSWHEQVVSYGAQSPAPEGKEKRVAEFRTLVGLMPEQPYLLFLSRLHAKKGADILIEAFVRVAKNWPKLHLVIAGPDPDGLITGLRTTAEMAGLGAHVHFPGLLQGDTKWGGMEGAEAFTLLTHQENFGIVLAEALASNTPVITTRRTNIWRELDQTGAAIICEDNTENATEALQRFLSLPEAARSEMRHKARAGYEAKFTSAAATRDLMQVLTEAASSAPDRLASRSDQNRKTGDGQ